MAVAQEQVLIVEDDVGLREALGRLLSAAGFAARDYASAEALLAAGPGGEAVCVVSDLRLPALSGLELLDEMRRRGWAQPMIVITAHDSPGLAAEARRRGAAAYLAKPFTGTALLASIAEVRGPSRK